MSLCTKSELSGGASKGGTRKIWRPLRQASGGGGKGTLIGWHISKVGYQKKKPRHQQQQGQLQRQFELIHKPKTVANAGLHARFYIFFGIVVHPLRECQPKTVTYINKSD